MFGKSVDSRKIHTIEFGKSIVWKMFPYSGFSNFPQFCLLIIPFLDSQVSVDFSEKQKRPGEKTKIVMKAKPGSHVAISALDKSVLLLKNADDLKKSKVREYN